MSALEPASSSSRDTCNIHMQIFGQRHTLPVPCPTGPQSIGALLPVAQQLTNQITALSLDMVRHQGRTISCRAGCGACCRQLVAISLVEAQALANLVASLPPERQAVIRERFAAAVRRLEEGGLLDRTEPKGERPLLDTDTSRRELSVANLAQRYFQQKIACPFLEEESCGIYADRPLVCREYHVTSPAENCARLYEIQVDRVEVPVHVGEAMAHTAHKVAGAKLQMIPLVLALEWAEAHPGALAQTTDGLGMLQTLMGELDRDHAQPLDQRPKE